MSRARIPVELWELHAEDRLDLARLSELVTSDQAGDAEFGASHGRADEALAATLDAQRHRLWFIAVDREPVGFIDAEELDGEVRLLCFVVEQWRGRGVATGALGRFFALGVFPAASVLVASIAPTNEAGRAIAASLGFQPAGASAQGKERWTRLPPATRARTGPERFLRPDGGIDRYPVGETDRREVLALVAARVITPGEVLDERAFTQRLRAFSVDTALLRRYLVDYGFVARTPSGSEYTAAPTGAIRVDGQTCVGTYGQTRV